ncbi:MAG: hypothetical protein IJT35_00220 [Paludibacteraceae bacterium]|nr:hypothetical protein [Paludibacteraceae bacterium]
MTKLGETFPMKDDGQILRINTPKSNLRVLWFVVKRNLTEYRALVILSWKDSNETEFKPRLGLKRFYGKAGMPSVRGLAPWRIIPKEMSKSSWTTFLSKLIFVKRRMTSCLRNFQFRNWSKKEK